MECKTESQEINKQEKQEKTHGGYEREGGVQGSKGGQIHGDGRLDFGGGHTTQYTDDVLHNCTLETYRILVAHVIPQTKIKKNNNKIKAKNEKEL